MHKKVTAIGLSVMAMGGLGAAAAVPDALASATPHVPTGCLYGPSFQYTYAGCSPEGVASAFTANAQTKVGTLLAPRTIITANKGGTVVVYDAGSTFSVPYDSEVTAYNNGTLIFDALSGKYGKAKIFTPGDTVKAVLLQTASGISYGADHTMATVLKYVRFFNGNKTESVTGSLLTHSKLLATLGTPTGNALAQVNSNILEYTKAEVKFIKARKAKKAAFTMTVGTTGNKAYTYKVLVPITSLKVAK